VLGEHRFERAGDLVGVHLLAGEEREARVEHGEGHQIALVFLVSASSALGRLQEREADALRAVVS
jgi:hypothetical protein